MTCLCMFVKDVDLTHCRLKECPQILGTMTCIKVLCLRQNLLKDVSMVTGRTTLVELDVYDNELKTIPDCSKLQQLE